jgi:hypothetical protein
MALGNHTGHSTAPAPVFRVSGGGLTSSTSAASAGCSGNTETAGRRYGCVDPLGLR